MPLAETAGSALCGPVVIASIAIVVGQRGLSRTRPLVRSGIPRFGTMSLRIVAGPIHVTLSVATSRISLPGLRTSTDALKRFEALFVECNALLESGPTPVPAVQPTKASKKTT